MKAFAVYTALRLGLFVGAVALVYAVWAMLAGAVPVLGLLVVAFLVSGVASYFLLQRPRAALAHRIDERASRVTQRFDDSRAREDAREDAEDAEE